MVQDAEELLQILVNIITEELKRPPKARATGLLTLLEQQQAGSSSKPRASSSSSGRVSEGEQRFANPLAGWMASTMQCCSCQHTRPVRNSEFIDVSLPLPQQTRGRRLSSSSLGFGSSSATAQAGYARSLLNGGSAVAPSMAPQQLLVSQQGGGGGGRGGEVHLLDCLSEFVREEVVQGVECANCTKQQMLRDVERAIAGWEG